MSEFPEEQSFKLITDLFENYDLAFVDSEDIAQVYCQRCDEIVCSLTYNSINDMNKETLYHTIIENHRKI